MTSVLELVYDDNLATSPVLTGVDNVVVNGAGELFVAEDGGDMQIVVIRPDRTFAPLLQIVGQDGSEITGPAFAPSGQRMYFSSQRGPGAGSGAGITYEVRGPFNGGPVGVPAAESGLLSGLVHGVVEPPVRSLAPPVADVVHAVDRGLAGLGL
jgi:secreted PhoX family phosphatase